MPRPYLWIFILGPCDISECHPAVIALMDHNDPMHMIGHNNKRIQRHPRKMMRHFIPNLLYNLTKFIQYHF